MTTPTSSPTALMGREPAVWLALLSAVLQAVSAFVLPLSPEWQAALNAVIAAGFGIWTAYKVAADKLLPAILGFVQAGANLAVAFGLPFAADKQAVLSSLVAVAVGMFVRTQVTAPVSASASRVR